MKTFKEFLQEPLNETYVNLIDNEKKDEYKQVVWDLLQKSYAKIGGIKGSGFKNPDDMLTIPFWKLIRKGGQIVAGKLYKDVGGRKGVAVFTNQTKEGIIALADLIANDFDRSMVEVSADMLRFVVRTIGMPKAVKYAQPVDKAASLLKKKLNTEFVDQSYKDTYPELSDFFYSREIGGSQHTKVLIGTPGNDLIDYL